MSVPSHIVEAFEKLDRLSTFVHFQSELLTRVHEDTGKSEEFLKDFHKLGTNVERVDFLYEKLQKYNLLKDKFTEDGKSDRKARKHKKKADKAFTKKRFVKGLQHYTRCIMKAQSQELLAMGYANRSATLFKLDMHEESLIDVERALSNNYPEHLKPSLITRKNKLMTMVGASKPLFTFHEKLPEIPDDRKNSFIPCASDSLEITVDEQSRRHIFAAKDIQIGEVVAVEKPFSFTVGAADLYHCHDCFTLCYNPIPCENCCQVLYCSEECRDNARIQYHQYECPILISLKNIVGKHKAFILAIKMSFMMDNEDFAPVAEDIYRLEENMDKKNINDELFTLALVTALMFHLVKNHTEKFHESDKDSEDKFKHFLMIHLRICLIHAAGIDELCPNFREDDEAGEELLQFKSETVACAVFPFYSLFRHACCPNVFAHHHGTQRVLRAIRSIKQGNECFVSYGPYYVEHSKVERQNRLSSQYHFTCKCPACVKDWPQLDLNPYYLKSAEDLTIVSRIRDANVEVALVGVNKFLYRIHQLELLEPLSDLTLYQKLLSYCYDILGNKRRIL